MSEASSTARGAVAITAPFGLHARPAARVVDLLREAGATLNVNGQPASSLAELMALGIRGDAVLELEVCGPAADDTLQALKTLLSEPLV